MVNDEHKETTVGQETRVGFEAALDEYYPEWRSIYSENQLRMLKHFYMAGVRDTGTLASYSVIGTGNKTVEATLESIKKGVEWMQNHCDLIQPT